MNETVFRFGPRDSLLGILTEPDAASSLTERPAVVLINAGIVHRVGPFRLHVNVARQLAGEGVTTLRIDLSGLGDSPMRVGKMESRERAIQDVRDALDALQSRLGHHRFVLMGLCSGAFNAHKVTVTDERVAGAVFMDGIAFRTMSYYLQQYGARMLRPRFWRNAIRRRMLRAVRNTSVDARENAVDESAFFDNEVVPTEVQAELNVLLDRGVRMLFMYTDGYDDIAGPYQFQEMFGQKPSDQLQLQYYDRSEHTFRLMQNRTIAVERIARWYREQFIEGARTETLAAQS